MKSSKAELLASLPESERQAILSNLTDPQLEDLLWDWKFWARPNQLPPEGDWLTWVILAGRGFGKTRTGAETIRDWACGPTPLSRGTYRRIALIAETAADARDVMVEGESGVLQCHPKDFRPVYEPSKRRLTWPNGAVATLYYGTEPDQLRGPQHDAGWLDELAKYAYAREVWDQFQFGLRLGNMPRSVITTTPRGIPLLKEVLAEEDTIVTKGRTMDNAGNLAEKFLNRVHARYAGTRLGRQELEAELLEDIPGALWTRPMFDPPEGSKARGRVNASDLPELTRIVVAVDPSGTSGDEDQGDSIGIVVAGVDENGHGYVLADRSVKEGPNGWGRAAVDAYKTFGADRIVGEANFGGAMVEAVMRSVDSSVSYKAVHASRGKVLRAEPVAALYEQGRVSHVTGADLKDKDRMGLTEVEDQLCLFSRSGYQGDGSPDRADALVWAITELMVEDDTSSAGVFVNNRRR